MNAKISVIVICVNAIRSLLFYNLHDCTFKNGHTEAMITLNLLIYGTLGSSVVFCDTSISYVQYGKFQVF